MYYFDICIWIGAPIAFLIIKMLERRELHDMKIRSLQAQSKLYRDATEQIRNPKNGTHTSS